MIERLRAGIVTLPRNLSLKTKLLLMMVSLLLLSVSALFSLHLVAQRRLLAQVRDYTEELSTAIEAAQQPKGGDSPAVLAAYEKKLRGLGVTEAESQTVLAAYAEKLKSLGVRGVDIADEANEVQASTNPQNVGKKLVQRRSRRTHEIVIRGVLGDTGPPGTQRTSTLTIPIVAGDRRIGSIVITRILDDFSALSEAALVSRIEATLGVFGLGILLSLYLSWSLSQPLQGLTRAARQVAGGDLSVEVPRGGGDEVGDLARTFNEMVVKLREHRQLEERLHFAERSTALGRLAAAVAHEIRNPLNFINLSIDHLRQRLAPEDHARRDDFDRILANMKAEISRLNRLVGDFLSFGKPMRLDPRACAVDEVLREVAALVDHKAKDQGIALVVDSDSDLPRIVADAELLKTCFLNLMINAVDAMPSGGVLTVTARRGTAEASDFLEITVADTGHGMAPEEAKSAFEPYFSTKDTGLGLGLALTRKIVNDHGGSISLESAPGRGTTARIQIPFEPTPLPAADQEAVFPPA